MLFPATFCFEALWAPAAGHGDVSEAGRIDVGHNILQILQGGSGIPVK